MVLTRALPQVETVGNSGSLIVGGENVRFEVDSESTDLSFQWYEGELGDRSVHCGTE